MKIVQFTRQAGVYNEGETAGFDDAKPHELEKAEKFVNAGAARYVELDADGKVIEPKAAEPELVDMLKELRAELGDKTKAELVAYAAEQFALELKVSSNKDELVEAIVAKKGERDERAAAEAIAPTIPPATLE
jgi:hypothetical protein